MLSTLPPLICCLSTLTNTVNHKTGHGSPPHPACCNSPRPSLSQDAGRLLLPRRLRSSQMRLRPCLALLQRCVVHVLRVRGRGMWLAAAAASVYGIGQLLRSGLGGCPKQVRQSVPWGCRRGLRQRRTLLCRYQLPSSPAHGIYQRRFMSMFFPAMNSNSKSN